METLKIEIYDHDTNIDVTHKVNTIELDNWINHLRYIKKEVSNLIKMCTVELRKQFINDTVIERLEKKGIENDKLLEALYKYVENRTNIAECDDTQCDMVFITEHESYRRSYLYHLDKYRRLKDDFFNKIHGTMVHAI